MKNVSLPQVLVRSTDKSDRTQTHAVEQFLAIDSNTPVQPTYKLVQTKKPQLAYAVLPRHDLHMIDT